MGIKTCSRLAETLVRSRRVDRLNLLVAPLHTTKWSLQTSVNLRRGAFTPHSEVCKLVLANFTSYRVWTWLLSNCWRQTGLVSNLANILNDFLLVGKLAFNLRSFIQHVPTVQLPEKSIQKELPSKLKLNMLAVCRVNDRFVKFLESNNTTLPKL